MTLMNSLPLEALLACALDCNGVSTQDTTELELRLSSYAFDVHGSAAFLFEHACPGNNLPHMFSYVVSITLVVLTPCALPLTASNMTADNSGLGLEPSHPWQMLYRKS